MEMSTLGLFVVGGCLILALAAAVYVERSRHPDAKPLAAYLIFVTVFAAVAISLFATGTLLFVLLQRPDLLATPAIGFPFLLFNFLPAFLAGRWQIKKPPLRAPRI